MADAAAIGSVGGAVSSIGNTVSQSIALSSQGSLAKQNADLNALISKYQANEALRRGQKDYAAVKRQGKQIRGAQRAALAAQGVEVDSGSAAEIQADTAEQVSRDANTAMTNAWREAFGYEVQGINFQMQGAVDEASAKNAMRSTIITGGLDALGYANQTAYWGQQAGWWGRPSAPTGLRGE